MSAPFIMLVDDEAAFVETTIKRLKKRNFETLSASSGEEGLIKLKSNQNLDVIILYVKMPGMDGIEMLKIIKADFPLIEVIMLTGHATIELGVQGMKFGAFDFLMKPYYMDELENKIHEATEKKRAHEKKIRDAERNNMLLKYEP